MNNSQTSLAVIGLNCRFPGANSADAFWNMLWRGIAPLNQAGRPIGPDKNQISVNIHVDDVDCFDADFFGYTPREAQIMDPQQRVFLQLGWEALEFAGYNPFEYSGLIGIFAGSSISTYLINHLLHHPALKAIGEFQSSIYNEKDYLTSLLAFHLNLKGPVVTVQSSCSTSLVAIHMACESLLSGQCDIALAGGITLTFPQEHAYLYQEGGLVSADGRVASFDASASGTVYSNGAGIVVLKRLDHAIRDGDHIISIIRGTAINNDGSARMSFSAPGIEGQSLVISEALALANILPESISYIETHGSGTPLGDAIEFEAMTKAFRESTDKKEFCAIGSVKTNIGHAQVAAGIAGFIKTCLSLYHKKLLPSLNFKTPNPKCSFTSSPFYVNTEPKDWKKGLEPRRACVNSFGLGGSNAHVVLEEYVKDERQEESSFPDICLLSAKTDSALKEVCLRYKRWIETHEDLNLNHFAFTTRVGRKAFPKRIAITFACREELIAELERRSLDSTYLTVQKPVSLFIQIGNEYLLDIDDLQNVLISFPNLTSFAVEIARLDKQGLDHPSRCLINSVVFLKVLTKLKIEYESLLVDGTCPLFVSYLDPHLPLEDLLQRFKREDELLNQISIIDLQSIKNFNEWKKENDRAIIDFDKDSSSAHLSAKDRFLNWIGHLWSKRISIDWSMILTQGRPRRVVLPSYPFETKRFFVDRELISEQIKQDHPLHNQQALIIEIWEEVMGLKIHDLSDNFFEQGGHSLLATQLLFTLEKRLNKRISLQNFLENPTVGGLVQCAEKLQTVDSIHNVFTEIEPDIPHRYDSFPLTDIQQAYWIGRHSELELGNIATHMYFENDLIDLDLDRFEYALNKCIERHDMLRAVILSNGTQKVLQAVDYYQIIRHDLSCETLEVQKQRLSTIREEMSHELISPDKWPLFKIVACRLNGHIIRLQISIDLLILDAWSIELWLKELSEIYQNPQQELPALRLNFRDYVLALKRVENSPLYAVSKNYWLERIQAGFSSAPQLPLMRAPSTIINPHFKRFKGRLTLDKWNAIKEIGKKFNVTPPVILVGAFSDVLRLWSSVKSFTLNLTMFNRLPLHPQVNEVLGDFTSLTLLEIKEIKNGSFLDRLKSIQHQVWQDLEHRYFSAPQVVKELMKNTESSSHHFPIVFTSLLNQSHINTPKDSPFKLSSTGEETYSVSQTPQVWLDHQVMEREDGMHFNWDVVDELFPTELIETMFEAYTKLLEELAVVSSNWEEKNIIRSSPVLNQLIFSNKNEVKTRESTHLLFTQFLERVEKEPERIAVAASSCSLTYQELEKLSRQVAHQLLQAGLKPAEMIAVVMDKSWKMLATIIGVLRAGGAYLPIDANYPVNRIQEMLSISQVKIVLCDSNGGQCSQNSVQKFIDINLNPSILPEIGDQLPDNYSNHQLAYGFFTSGSTGQPKCVEVTHLAAINTIEAVNAKYRVDKEDAVLCLSSFSFDLSVYDIFGLLSVGGKIVIPDVEQAKDPQAWGQLITENHVTVWNTTPAFMQMFYGYISNTEQEDSLKNLRLVLLSGDKIPVYLPIALKNIYHIPNVVSLGGATEAGIWSIWYDIQGNETNLNSIPYGRAMPNQQFYILDEHLEECPIWMDGELYIGGTSLALGYRNNLEETTNRFITHPKWGRIYKTGDRGRYMNSGLIEFLGRQDSQVKIRGHRIELGEIEAKLNQHESVKSAIVVVDQDENEQKSLTAFVELQPGYAQNMPSLPEGILTDPIERLQFKSSEHGYRKDLPANGIQLSSAISEDLQRAFLHRRSYRQFNGGQMKFSQLEQLLTHLRVIEMPGLPFGKRLYGSGGGLYPIQAYIHVQKDKILNLAKGIYYYHPKLHQLNLVNEQDVDFRPLFPPNNRELLNDAAFTIFLVSNCDAIVPMYGREESDKLALLEAGLMTQLLEMAAANYKIGLCQVSGLDFGKIKWHLTTDVNSEVVHCLIGGTLDEAQLELPGLIKDLDSYHANEKKTLETDSSSNPIESIREFLICYLPDYMVPTKLYEVPVIPLTANGKLDRRACLSLKYPEKQINQNNVEACSLGNRNHALTSSHFINLEVERGLTEIWKDALPGKAFSPTDHFFDIGGNSISLVHVYRAIQSQINQKISMADLFKYPTIRALSNFLNQRQMENGDQAVLDEEDNRAVARREALKKRKETSLA